MLVDKIIAQFTHYDRVLLIAHENPDGDTLAATTALALALKKIGKNPTIVCRDAVPKPFSFLITHGLIGRDFLFGDFDLIVTVDCGDIRRTGFDLRLKEIAHKKKFLINIDHHPKNDLHKLANLNLVDYSASSSSEIIYNLLLQMNLEIDKEIATALFTGLYTDTGGFKHSNTQPKTLKIAGDLLKCGARIKLVTKNVSLNKSIAAMRLWGIALSRLKRNEILKIAVSVLTQKDIAECQASEEDVAGVINLINTIPDSKAAILFYETSDKKIRASIRTEDDKVDISKIAALFGGGGHRKASGFTLDGEFVFDNLDSDWRIAFR